MCLLSGGKSEELIIWSIWILVYQGGSKKTSLTAYHIINIIPFISSNISREEEKQQLKYYMKQYEI